MVVIDGSYGEGGGQVLRMALALSAILQEPVRIENIRAGRPNPGLQAQHLTGVMAIAKICQAELRGAELGSKELTFRPRRPPQPGSYFFDVTEARKGGSAGATTLVLQTLLLPLALAKGTSTLTLKGGTHVSWSPPFHYVQQVLFPTLARMGIRAEAQLKQWGWYPVGGGEISVTIHGGAQIKGITLDRRGKLRRIRGISAYSNLPDHVGLRQKEHAVELLRRRGFEAQIEVVKAPSPGKGSCLFLLAEFENVLAGFTSLGERGKPAEKVAEEAVQEFLDYMETDAALDPHLADQLILPAALAQGPVAFTTARITKHLLTGVWVVERFMGQKFAVEGKEGHPGRVSTV
jgi:RNA 3'-terminal phosphate cyclase (ATP)